MNDRSQMTLARLGELLDAYGANSERWPPAEREAACALLAQSAEAQRRREASAQRDAILNLAPAHAASPALLERILAAAPQHGRAEMAPAEHLSLAATTQAPGLVSPRASRRARRPLRAWRYVGAALPLAAAAALVLWLLREPAPTPERTRVTMADLASYDVPTDALLAAPGLEALDSVPSFGCTGSGLGCLDPEPLNKQSTLDWETYV
jgi:ferric-dicitrate binding protein FerR (iron transport regulator)